MNRFNIIALETLLLAPLAALQAADVHPVGDSRPAANLLVNPSFEEKAGDGVAGWTSRAWAGREATRWAVEVPGRTGEHCVCIASDRGGDAAWTTTASVQTGAWYRLSAWIKTKEVGGAVGALLNIQNMQGVRTPAVSGTRDWTRVETVFQSEAAQIEVNCLFGGWGSSTGQAWYDDVVLESLAGPPEENWAAVTIDTAAPSRPYSPMIFGGFLEHFERQVYGGVFEPGSPLADENGFRRDVIAALKELKVPVVRWPGGCYVSGYHWEAGVGKARRPTDDMAWGVVEPNTFGTDEYVELCRMLGWTPYICNNAGNGTVEEMRNWVEYCNAREGRYAQLRRDSGYAEPRNVPIWSIGNENWGQHEIGYKPIEQWAPLVLEAAKAMKAADPRIRLTAAALPSREWTRPLLKAAGDYLDYISIHCYWLPLWGRNDMPDYLTCIMHSESPEKMIGDYIGVLEEAGYRGRIKIAFDEWNLRAWHHPGFPRKTVQDYNDPEVRRLVAARENNAIASQYNMADALFSASFFNACLRHAEDVGMANIAPLVNTRGPLFVHPGGIVKRTHFHAMALYANELEPRVGQLELEAGKLRNGNRSIPVVDAIATVDESGKKWSLALVNRHPSKTVACTVTMKDKRLDGPYAALVLTGDSPEAFNDIDNPDRVTPQKTILTFDKGNVALPPHSLIVVKVPLTNNVTLSGRPAEPVDVPAGGRLPRIRVDAANKGFVDSTGRRFTPRGVSYYRPGTGWAPQLWRRFDAGATRQDFRRMKRMGLNVARVFVTFGSFYTRPGELDPAGLAAFDRMLDLADEAGIYLHPTGPEHWEGMPPWAQSLGGVFDNFANDECLKALEDFWRMFAGRYRGRSTIWAYDLRNEPTTAWDTPQSRVKWDAWRIAHRQPVVPVPDKKGAPSAILADYQRFRESLAEAWVARQAQAIRAADPRALVTVGLLQWSVPAQPVSVDQYTGFRPDVIARHLDFLSLHFYPLAKGVYRYDGQAAEDANLAVLECMTRECAKPGKPVVIAEFGWYGGGPLNPGGTPADEEQQARWCRRLVEVTAPMACGWINWGLYDTPEARDVSRLTGLVTTGGVDKAWGKLFGPLVKRLPPPRTLPARPDLPWESCTMDGGAAARFQALYLESFLKERP